MSRFLFSKYSINASSLLLIKNRFYLCFCFFLLIGTTDAQITSSLFNNALTIESDFLNYSTLTHQKLQMNQQSKFTILDVGNPSFLMSDEPSATTATLSDLKPAELLLKSVSTSPGNSARLTKLTSFGLDFTLQDIDANHSRTWLFSSYRDNDDHFLNLSRGEFEGNTGYVLSVFSFGYIDGDSSPYKFGVNNDLPEYSLDVYHGLSSSTWNDGNGLALRNSAGNDRDWLHYVVNASGNYSFYADGLVKGNIDYTSGNWVPISDRRLKKKIKPISNQVLQEINKLNPTTYQYKSQENNRKVYGLIAQEVQKVFPDIVIPMDESGETIGISYTELIPILIAGMQEQQNLIQKQTNTIERLVEQQAAFEKSLKELKNEIGLVLLGENNKVVSSTLTKAKLFQNAPNPFANTTQIGYFLPQNTSKAVLKIHSNNGQLVKEFPLQQTGQGMVEVNTFAMGTGTYIYSLWIDNQMVESKQMLLVHK